MSLIAAMVEAERQLTCHICDGKLFLLTVMNQKSQATGLYKCKSCGHKRVINTEGKRI